MRTKSHFLCQNISQVFSIELGIYNFGTTIDMEMMEFFSKYTAHSSASL